MNRSCSLDPLPDDRPERRPEHRASRARAVDPGEHRSLIAGFVAARLVRQLDGTATALGATLDEPPYAWIRPRIESLLTRIGEHLDAGISRPDDRARARVDEAPRAPLNRRLRLGVFPVSANPLHWGHVLFSLEAIAALGLDQVVFIIQGRDPRKAELAATEDHRHRLARDVLQLLQPLAICSDLGLGNSLPGEDNVFRLLRLNSHRRVDAWYMAGCDHFRCLDGAGDPATLARLEANLARRQPAFDHSRHRLRVLFARRTCQGPCDVGTALTIRFLPEVLLASSTAVRRGDLSLVPWAVVEYLLRNRDYALALGLQGPGGPRLLNPGRPLRSARSPAARRRT